MTVLGERVEALLREERFGHVYDELIQEIDRYREQRDEAIALLHRAAFRLVPISPFDEIKAFLERVDGER